jgi:hypothetical protein
MVMLLQDREDQLESPVEVLPEVPHTACPACGAGMSEGQDWCLECGTAAPGSLGAGRPSWRQGLAVAGVTLALLGGAVVASWAAITGDAQRSAAAPAQGDANPIVAQPPPAPAPPAPTSEPPEAAEPSIPSPSPQEPIDSEPALPPTDSPSPAPVDPPASTPAPSVGGGSAGGGATGGGTTAPAALRISRAFTYDPYDRPGAEFGRAAAAIDGSESTVWDVTVPADGDPVGAGLLLDLGSAQGVRSLRLLTSTPGFTAEIYATRNATTPSDLDAAGWQHVTDVKNVSATQSVSLGKVDGRARKLLVWITDAGDAQDPRVAIKDVSVRGS